MAMPDGQAYRSATDDAPCAIWEMETGKQLRIQLTRHRHAVALTQGTHCDRLGDDHVVQSYGLRPQEIGYSNFRRRAEGVSAFRWP